MPMLFDDLNDDEELFDASGWEGDEDGHAMDTVEIAAARGTATLFEHRQIEKTLLHMLETGRFPHGLIFSGPAGIGKSVMAFRLARFLFSEKDHEPDMFGAPEPAASLYVAQNHPIFAKVQSGGHPDMLTIARPIDDSGRMKASVPVEEIRKIAPFMRRTASVDDGWRIVIVDDADTMTRSSQNSLLKILEEPPEKALLILITHRAGALLPTVYSRCVHIPFQQLGDKTIRDALSGGLSGDDLDLVVAMAEGSLGRAREYAVPDHLSMIRDSLAFFESWPDFQWSAIQDFAETFGLKGNDDAQRIFRETFLWLLSSLVRGKTGGIKFLARMQETLPLGERLAIYDRLLAHFNQCQYGNLDKRFLILGAYMSFEG